MDSRLFFYFWFIYSSTFSIALALHFTCFNLLLFILFFVFAPFASMKIHFKTRNKNEQQQQRVEYGFFVSFCVRAWSWFSFEEVYGKRSSIEIQKRWFSFSCRLYWNFGEYIALILEKVIRMKFDEVVRLKFVENITTQGQQKQRELFTFWFYVFLLHLYFSEWHFLFHYFVLFKLMSPNLILFSLVLKCFRLWFLCAFFLCTTKALLLNR